MVVDIRSVPRSRANPQFNLDTLPGALRPGRSATAISGARRVAGQIENRSARGQRVLDPSELSNYADYALSDAFREGLSHLLELSEMKRSAIMCSEAVWWRCHRRIVADYLLIRGRTVLHLMGAARIEPAALTEAARPHGDALVYPAG